MYCAILIFVARDSSDSSAAICPAELCCVCLNSFIAFLRRSLSSPCCHGWRLSTSSAECLESHSEFKTNFFFIRLVCTHSTIALLYFSFIRSIILHFLFIVHEWLEFSSLFGSQENRVSTLPCFSQKFKNSKLKIKIRILLHHSKGICHLNHKMNVCLPKKTREIHKRQFIYLGIYMNGINKIKAFLLWWPVGMSFETLSTKKNWIANYNKHSEWIYSIRLQCIWKQPEEKMWLWLVTVEFIERTNEIESHL